jgi:predicted lactoylglutathione lyase
MEDRPKQGISMIRRFYLNLPVKDVARSRAFFAALGYRFDPQFTGEEAACLAISETAYVMLLPHARFAQFTTKPIADTGKTSAGLISLWRDSRAEVDAELEAAVKAGAVEAGQPEDLGFMYMRGYYDLDGHGWGINWMDPAAAPPA